ncbi:DUF742 domain-containing protein [Streptomyces malaysiensis]|uniref:DUF742 domain-containing protein n=1 Tax=Streptomyces malaysiensis subsp. samsunensis TaxID=459658 RepID=A0A9X2M2W3_STRMQ|nr:DUF742 domain-containing protein [Streptomyces samsunensis]MCQ8834307.1 DUF742 domain-containing protein [Streptomyces samsunensis]
MSTGEGPSGQGPGREQGAEDEQTFADVLNAFSFGKGRRGRKTPRSDGKQEPRSRREAADAGPDDPTGAFPGASSDPDQPAVWESEHDESQGPASLVRAYSWTGGRTRSDHHFEVETLVTTTDLGHRSTATLQADHRPVIALCQEPRSVAEVAAMLSVPLGVAKVLLGDMAERGLITVHRTASADGETPDVSLMERVLVGLRRI